MYPVVVTNHILQGTALIIDKNNTLPLHAQLKAFLVERITSGYYAPGSRIPSERELCDEFNISRTTVRETIRQMEKDGLILKVAARGMFVAEPKHEVDIRVSLDGYTSDLKRQGLAPSSKLISINVIPKVDESIAKKMQLAPGDEVVKIVRIRLINNSPLALHTAFLNYKLCPNILNHNLTQESLFQILITENKLQLTHAEEKFYAALANPEENHYLNLNYPAAVLRTERITFIDTGEIIEYAIASYAGETYRMVTEIRRPD